MGSHRPALGWPRPHGSISFTERLLKTAGQPSGHSCGAPMGRQGASLHCDRQGLRPPLAMRGRAPGRRQTRCLEDGGLWPMVQGGKAPHLAIAALGPRGPSSSGEPCGRVPLALWPQQMRWARCLPRRLRCLHGPQPRGIRINGRGGTPQSPDPLERTVQSALKPTISPAEGSRAPNRFQLLTNGPLWKGTMALPASRSGRAPQPDGSPHSVCPSRPHQGRGTS